MTLTESSLTESSSEEIQEMSLESTSPRIDERGEPGEGPAAHTESAAAELLSSDPGSGSYATLIELVERIRSGRTDGMAELYQLFSKGIRFYLCRQLGPQELDDKIHDTFV